MRSELKWLMVVIALQSLWVLGMVVTCETQIRRGAVVLLETATIDPRDWLRGDYLILNYRISTVPTNLISGFVTNAPAPGTPIFVRLSRQGPFHRVESASMRPVEAKDGSPVLRGRISERSAWWPGRRGSTNVSVIVDYGLERYYVREGTGSPTGTLTVEATVATSGNGFIRQVFLDGKPYAEAMRGQAR